MTFKWHKYLNVMCLWLCIASAQATNIYQQEMIRLDQPALNGQAVETLNAYRGKPMVVSFFMPNCKWCQKQHKSLKKIQQECPASQMLMLGVQGNNQRLKQALRKDRNHFPAYVANATILKAVGSQSPVPMTLIFDKSGELVLKTVGFTSKEKLMGLLLEKNIDICHSI